MARNTNTDRKHTHTGTCQICERRQAINPVNGNIAKHGYTVDWGYFNGTCPGSDHQPYEASCALIPSIIAGIDGELQQRVNSRKCLVAFPADRGYFTFTRYLRNPKSRQGRSDYQNISVVGTFTDYDATFYDGGTYKAVRFTADEPATFWDNSTAQIAQTQGVTRDGPVRDELHQGYGDNRKDDAKAFAAEWKQKALASHDHYTQMLTDYRDRLQARVDNWKRRELLPVVNEKSAKDLQPGDQLDINGTQVTVVRHSYKSSFRGGDIATVVVKRADGREYSETAAYITKLLRKAQEETA